MHRNTLATIGQLVVIFAASSLDHADPTLYQLFDHHEQAGWRCVFTPEAQIIHQDGGSKSTAQIRSKMYVQMQKSHLIYMRKHEGNGSYLVVKSVLIGSAFLRLALFGALRLVRSNAVTEARLRLSKAALRYHLFGWEATK